MANDKEYRNQIHNTKVSYRCENGEVMKGSYLDVLSKFEKEQEDILKTIPSITLKDLTAHLLSKDDFEKVEAIRVQH